MAMQPCLKCKRNFDGFREKVCSNCYNKLIFKGQCLNLAAQLIREKSTNKEFYEHVFGVAKQIYEHGLKEDYLNW